MQLFFKQCTVSFISRLSNLFPLIRCPAVALVSNLPEEHMAIGTGFVQLLRGLGNLFFNMNVNIVLTCS